MYTVRVRLRTQSGVEYTTFGSHTLKEEAVERAVLNAWAEVGGPDDGQTIVIESIKNAND